MPIKNYKITIDTDQDFNCFQKEEATQYLLNNLDKIDRNRITILTENIDWEKQVKIASSDIWCENDLMNCLDNNIKIDVFKLSFEYAKKWFKGKDRDTTIQCLKQLNCYSNKDFEKKDLNTYWQGLQKKAINAFAEEIENRINYEIEYHPSASLMPF